MIARLTEIVIFSLVAFYPKCHTQRSIIKDSSHGCWLLRVLLVDWGLSSIERDEPAVYIEPVVTFVTFRSGPPSRHRVISQDCEIGNGHHRGVHQGPSGHDHAPLAQSRSRPESFIVAIFSLKYPADRGGCVWTPHLTQAFSSVVWLHAVRCCRVSGLSMRHVTRRGPSWRCADRIHIAYASSKALHPQTGFSDPVSVVRDFVLPDRARRIVDEAAADFQATGIGIVFDAVGERCGDHFAECPTVFHRDACVLGKTSGQHERVDQRSLTHRTSILTAR